VPSEEHPLELDVRARRLSTLRPSPVTTLVLCHASHIVLQTPVRETGPAVPMGLIPLVPQAERRAADA